jgi:UDP-glucose 4-epimerase
LGSPAITHIPKRPGEPDCTWADIDKIKRELGWEPKVTFAEGVRRLNENAEDWSEAPVWTAAEIAKATADWFRLLGPQLEESRHGEGVGWGVAHES